MLKDYQDAHGHEIYDYLNGRGGYEIVERDDGYVDASGGAKDYFAEYKDWQRIRKRRCDTPGGESWILAAAPEDVCSIYSKRVWMSWA